MGHLVVWIDHNNDGWLDFYGSSGTVPFFFQNNGDGTFQNITAISGLAQTNPESVSVGDFDNDGFSDLLITSNNLYEPVKVYRNNAGNGFEVVFSGLPASRAIWLDYNGDGILDFFCTRGSLSPLLYQGTGNVDFIDVTSQMGFSSGSGRSAAAGDYNNDGFADIYCAVYGQNKLFANHAGGYFTDESFSAMVADFRYGVAQSWGDYNQDGWLDLYVANITSNRNILYRNNADGTFTDVTLFAGVADAGDARTCAWVDANNDGLVDLFTTNHVFPNRLFRNNGNGTFTDIAVSSGIQSPQDGFGVSWGDFDRDGDQDVLICGHSYAVRLLRNDGGNESNFINILLSGSYDNKNGIGSRLELYHGERYQMGEVNAGTGSTGQNALALHFGLGSDTLIDSLVITWPSGMRQIVSSLSANQFITVYQEGNVPPSVFHLISPPPDSVISENQVTFLWGTSTDPDHAMPIEYALHIYSQYNDTIITGLTDTSYLFHFPHWIATDTVLWYITASDGLDYRASWEQWHLNYSGISSITGRPSVTDIFVIRSIAPQPAGNTSVLLLDVHVASSISMKLFHPTGVIIKEFPPQWFNRGQHQVTIDLSGCTPGMYILKVNARDITKGGILIKI